MRNETRLGCLLFCVAVFLGGCSSEPAPPPPPPEIEQAPATEEPAPPPEDKPPAPGEPGSPPAEAEPPPEIEQAPATEEPAPPPAETPPAPGEPERPPAEAEPPPSPPPPAPDAALGVVDAGGVIEVAATKPGLSRIGAEKCKLCHKVQFASWSETAHAARTPPLDCEGCHGPGSEYKSLAVMKDPEKARAAGLVMPDRSFCSECHRSGWTEEMLNRAHDHKAEAS